VEEFDGRRNYAMVLGVGGVTGRLKEEDGLNGSGWNRQHEDIFDFGFAIFDRGKGIRREFHELS
jgi:hypothetical protein